MFEILKAYLEPDSACSSTGGAGGDELGTERTPVDISDAAKPSEMRKEIPITEHEKFRTSDGLPDGWMKVVRVAPSSGILSVTYYTPERKTVLQVSCSTLHAKMSTIVTVFCRLSF